MTPLEFLAVVLPSPGHGLYCLAEMKNSKSQVFEDDPANFYPKIDQWVEQQGDVYFALSTFG